MKGIGAQHWVRTVSARGGAVGIPSKRGGPDESSGRLLRGRPSWPSPWRALPATAAPPICDSTTDPDADRHGHRVRPHALLDRRRQGRPGPVARGARRRRPGRPGSGRTIPRGATAAPWDRARCWPPIPAAPRASSRCAGTEGTWEPVGEPLAAPTASTVSPPTTSSGAPWFLLASAPARSGGPGAGLGLPPGGAGVDRTAAR